ncbi:MAG: hypothetical protein E7508_09495 [Ruminococcus sp.]|nr:hypothetical protein [Ruminococcus sp.]
MEITNCNLQLTSTVAKQNTQISNQNTVTQSDNNLQNDVIQANTDRFIQNDCTKEEIGIYSPNSLSNSSKESEILTSKTSAVQLNSTSSTNVCLDAIKRAAAKKAGVPLSSEGNPNINSGWESNTYYGEISRINNCFYCQTGGWNLPNNGIKACGRTAVATMVSINSGYTVTPNDTTGNGNKLTGIYVNGSMKTLTSSGTYKTSTGAGTGLCQYSCGSENGVISAINNELKNGRSVMVKTTVSGEHWVTVTGTIDGELADSFEDFVGIDPWYNGNNPGNVSTGTGDGATKTNRAGVIQLSNVSGQNLHGDYSIITYKA